MTAPPRNMKRDAKRTPVPEEIDYAIDHDPDGAEDPCVHDGDEPHNHVKRAKNKEKLR